MKYIFNFIEKVRLSLPHLSLTHVPLCSQEKQAENIIEKLCQRFRLTDEVRQWRDIAYCLSLLPFKSDRSVKKLIEGLQFYRDKLHEESVYVRFQEILTKVRRCRRSKSQRSPLTCPSGTPKQVREQARRGAQRVRAGALPGALRRASLC